MAWLYDYDVMMQLCSCGNVGCVRSTLRDVRFPFLLRLHIHIHVVVVAVGSWQLASVNC